MMPSNAALTRRAFGPRVNATLARHPPMRRQQCPLCFGPLEVRDVAPCAECGAQPEEVEHLREGRHTYQVLRVLGGFEVI